MVVSSPPAVAPTGSATGCAGGGSPATRYRHHQTQLGSTVQDHRGLLQSPDIDPLSDWLAAYSLISGIELVIGEFDDKLRVSRVDVTIHVPPGTITVGLEERVRAGMGKNLDRRADPVA